MTRDKNILLSAWRHVQATAVDIVRFRSVPDLEQMKQLPDRKLDPGTGKEVAPDKQ
jgi:hypothetical protein